MSVSVRVSPIFSRNTHKFIGNFYYEAIFKLNTLGELSELFPTKSIKYLLGKKIQLFRCKKTKFFLEL